MSFRWAADEQLRDALRDVAGDSRHAVRLLARAWADIIWRCWQDNRPDDPDQHGALQGILNQDQPATA